MFFKLLRMLERPQIYQLIAAIKHKTLARLDTNDQRCRNSPELDAGQSDPQVESVPAARAGPC